jgi:hypothetical protein
MNDVSIVGPEDGEVIELGPTRMCILEDGGTTAHRLGIGEITLAPHSSGPLQHRHARHDEGFYVGVRPAVVFTAARRPPRAGRRAAPLGSPGPLMGKITGSKGRDFEPGFRNHFGYSAKAWGLIRRPLVAILADLLFERSWTSARSEPALRPGHAFVRRNGAVTGTRQRRSGLAARRLPAARQRSCRQVPGSAGSGTTQTSALLLSGGSANPQGPGIGPAPGIARASRVKGDGEVGGESAWPISTCLPESFSRQSFERLTPHQTVCWPQRVASTQFLAATFRKAGACDAPDSGGRACPGRRRRPWRRSQPCHHRRPCMPAPAR